MNLLKCLLDDRKKILIKNIRFVNLQKVWFSGDSVYAHEWVGALAALPLKNSSNFFVKRPHC
jgi:hypothetical protein